MTKPVIRNIEDAELLKLFVKVEYQREEIVKEISTNEGQFRFSKKDLGDGPDEDVLNILIRDLDLEGVLTSLHNVCCHGRAFDLSGLTYEINYNDNDIRHILDEILKLRNYVKALRKPKKMKRAA